MSSFVSFVFEQLTQFSRHLSVTSVYTPPPQYGIRDTSTFPTRLACILPQASAWSLVFPPLPRPDRSSSDRFNVGHMATPLLPCDAVKGLDSDFVTTHRHKIFRLRCPTGARLRIAGLEDTMYRDDDYEVKSWGAFYLPDEVKMQVFGVVEGTSCPYDQLVLMTCEDGRVYAFDGEELHAVASSWNELCKEGLGYPGSETYYDGEAFKHMTEEDWEEEWKSPLGQMLEEKHDKLVAESLPELLEHLELARRKRDSGLRDVERRARGGRRTL
uniref:Uncharacterized protein n=1 Tax=Monopterus albus TaxID=43700 RepID=A0A3Q3QTE3_MONAL